MKNLAILGSTGSIGLSTLEVIAAHRERFKVKSLAAARSVEALAAQAALVQPELLAVLDAEAADKLKSLLPAGLKAKVVHGPQGYLEAAAGCGADMVVSAMVGAAGLLPTYAALKAGIDVALANKETLVAAGELVMAAAKESGAAIIPVDSEHSAIFQSLMGNPPEAVKRIWLTASGGPFRDHAPAQLAQVTPEMALDHPNWSMGPKITIDSATLMNKGLEVIEAHWLFGRGYDEITVVVHPQSVVHSLVEYVDGSFIAQLGQPDMKTPIAFALSYPQRLALDLPQLDLAQVASLTFTAPDLERFPALGLALAAGRAGGSAPAVLNAANEVAVGLFLHGKLGFTRIAACVQGVLEAHQTRPLNSVAAVLETDREARALARAWAEKQGEAA
ncbi:MAG: 1-deoxy-D-xylulose-5-phosphate reductoisomerase [Desulfarculaceae bacterium]|nr:1-deoxy-D-xylulose-5-phosphate reductoisomerase [Desulfarculaceae bacterium]MCF8071007.1 1-deoxy-D-xylulose-5-phosphate reductoisomerase [Desulfarculaceae bacterium]MCF8100595.1 1-deoxy-D-xylulose-5-phosphate reductoisomerase [Desulfarculaceae bacterium]MCF8117727.1 1-deoxy-D-xylulose-5-phosphate reductoisomerase [Desulfarculaceae bacterium]